MSEYDIDSPGYSDALTIDPDSIIEKVKITGLAAGLLKAAAAANDEASKAPKHVGYKKSFSVVQEEIRNQPTKRRQ